MADVDFKFAATDNSYAGEAAIALADLGITGDSFNFALTFSAPDAGIDEEENEVYECLVYPKYEKTENDPLANAPYKDGGVFATLALADITIAEDTPEVEADFSWDIVTPKVKRRDHQRHFALKGLAEGVEVGAFSMFVNFSDNLIPVVTTPVSRAEPLL